MLRKGSIMPKKIDLHSDIDHILIDEPTLKNRVKELAARLTEEYKGKNPIFVCILKGSVNFFSDLTREFDDYCEYDFMSVSSYGKSMKTTGYVRILKDLDMTITDRHVIIVEDIMDSGRMLDHLTCMLRERKPASLKLITLLDKPNRRACAISPDYYGFVIPDEFVVGYGLDFAGIYRNLPYIGVLKEEVYK